MCDNHSHNHEHSHDGHTHTHTHSHEGGAHHSPEETRALLSYMIEHNEHHGEDLHEIYHALADGGSGEAAELVHAAMHLYEEGNDKLKLALERLGGK